MMDGADLDPLAAVRAMAVAYCEGIHHSTVATFEAMCHDHFLMTARKGSGEVQFWDKAGYLDRVKSRTPFPGEPSYEILSVDVAGDEIARVHLYVDAPPRRYEDHLGFVRVGAEWKLMTKVFRVADGPALEG